jgi:hypothetical protein
MQNWDEGRLRYRRRLFVLRYVRRKRGDFDPDKIA